MKPCLFLDRDGVIIQNVPYATEADTVVLCPGIVDLIRRAQQLDYWVICVTNQSGIGRGWVPFEAYQAITARMNELLAQEGCKLDHIYFAAYYAKTTDPRWLENANWRKPEPGMLHQACRDFAIDLSRSVMVGDRSIDVEAGERAGVGRKVLIASKEFPNEIPAVPANIVFEFARHPDEILF